MRAVFPTDKLKAAVSAISPVVPNRTPMDVLKNIKIVVDHDSCEISARDAEMSAVIFVRGVECGLPGEILLPCDRFSQILREASGDVVRIDCDDGIANVTIGRSKFRIPTEDPTTLEVFCDFPETGYRTVAATDMKRIAARCCIVSNEEKNSAFGGVHFEFIDGLNCVSSDGKCLSMVTCVCGSEGDVPATEIVVDKRGFPSEKSQKIVSKRALKVLQSCLGSEGTVDIATTADTITLRHGDVTIRSQLIHGMYPNWRRVFPSSCQRNIELSSPHLANAIRQSMITTEAESACVDFVFADGVLTLKSHGKGDSTVELPISFDGKYQFLMDPKFVLTAISLADRNGSITIGINSPEKPILITSNDGLRFIAATTTRGE